MEWLVKVGGSLFPENAIRLCKALVGRKVLVVCGGGVFADKIREYDGELHFSNTASHKTAIQCMDIMGMLISDKVEDSVSIYSLEDAEKAINKSKLPILMPSKLLRCIDPLEHSWKVTSDSLSFYISHLLQTKMLIATNVDGIYTHKPSSNNAELLKTINAKKLLSFGETSVDEILPQLLLEYKSNCYVVNGKYPERAISIIESRIEGNMEYTYIRGD